MVSSTRLDSFLPSLVQMAPCAVQSVVMGNTMVTSAFEDGWLQRLCTKSPQFRCILHQLTFR